MKAKEIIQEIIANSSEQSVNERVDELKIEFINQDDLEDYDNDIDDLYEETGRNGAECQVMQELLEPYELDENDHVKVYETIKDHYELVTG